MNETSKTAHPGWNILAFFAQLPLNAVFSGGAGGARARPEFGGAQKRRCLISAYQSLAITTNTPGFEKLNSSLICTGKTLSEALIFASTNPQYGDRFFIEL